MLVAALALRSGMSIPRKLCACTSLRKQKDLFHTVESTTGIQTQAYTALARKHDMTKVTAEIPMPISADNNSIIFPALNEFHV